MIGPNSYTEIYQNVLHIFSDDLTMVRNSNILVNLGITVGTDQYCSDSRYSRI